MVRLIQISSRISSLQAYHKSLRGSVHESSWANSSGIFKKKIRKEIGYGIIFEILIVFAFPN